MLLALCGCGGESSSPGPSAELSSATSGVVAEGARLEADGRWMEAAALYRQQALGGQPPSNGALIRQALVAYYMADRPAEADKFAAKVREKWPAFHEVLLYLADLQRVTTRYEEARRTVESFLALEPDHIQGILVSGLIFVALGETESGLRAIERYLQHEGADPEQRAEAEVVRVRALRGLGRYHEAADAITRVLETRPLDPVALAEAAQSYALDGNEILSRAASQQHAWLSRRGHRLTVEDPLTLDRTGPRPEGRARLALQARDRREFLGAIRALRSLLARDPDDSRLAYLLGRLWLRLGRYHECREISDAFEKTGAALNPELLHLRAFSFKRQGSARDASAEWRRAVDAIDAEGTGGEGSSAVEQPAMILLAAADHLLEIDGDLDLAGRWYAAAARRSPATSRPIAGEIRISIRKGELDRAQALLEQLGTWVDPKTSEAYLRLDATVRGLRGDLRFAARQLTSLIVKYPTHDQNFTAFMRVFGDEQGVAEVEQVRRLRDQWSARRRAADDARKRLSARPFEECAAEYHGLGVLAMEVQDKDGALDAFLMAAALDPAATVGLKAAMKVLQKPGDVFVRLHSMRRILERDPDDGEILALLARTYIKLGVRGKEAMRIATQLAKLRPGSASEQLLKEARAR